MPFEEVWSRSYCRTRETLVDVLSEFPQQTEHVFKPPCVPLRRCAGCCGDEGLECAPLETRPLDLQVVQVSPLLGTTQQVQLTFTEHERCACSREPEGGQLRACQDGAEEEEEAGAAADQTAALPPMPRRGTPTTPSSSSSSSGPA
ncbi:placenta growth factor-like [Heteronotia binoei]|uniref:placenta growth factor-like n=1 Tax=Heteronotia binoei TaxID=13085 RepID=UPI00292ED7F8|nr:placenta growth factor-like [Heteronotia binoei]